MSTLPVDTDRRATGPAASEAGAAFGRLPLLVPAMIALLAGLDAGLLLMGVWAPVVAERLPEVHGVLLVAGFVGTLIALERAVAAGRIWGYVAPLGLGVGGVLLLTPAPLAAGRVAIIVGSLLLCLLYVPLWRRQPSDAVLVQGFGAVLLTGSALLWSVGLPISELLPWLAGFPILTIAGERLELARVGAPSQAAQRVLALLSLVVLLCGPVTLLWPGVGYRLFALTLLGLVAWLWQFDVARRTVRSRGLPRFIGGCLLAGYFWLAVAAVLWLQWGLILPDGSAGYDAVIHAVFIGFVLSMIFAHAPIILPALLRCTLPYSRIMYLAAGLLQLSLMVRLGLGDALNLTWARQAGGVGNAVAILFFAAIVLTTARKRTRRTRRERPGRRER